MTVQHVNSCAKKNKNPRKVKPIFFVCFLSLLQKLNRLW